MKNLKSQDIMKIQNTKNILKIIHDNKGIHRKLIAEKANLATQTVTNIVGELYTNNVLLEAKTSIAKKGRNPSALEINYSNFYIITIDVKVGKLALYLHTLENDILYQKEMYLIENSDVLSLIKTATSEMIKAFKKEVSAIVISVEGIVNEDLGMVTLSKSLNWKNINIKEMLSLFGVPVFVKNDVNLIADYEKTLHREDKNLLLIKLDNGIGSCLVNENRVLKSTNSVSGELGHYKIFSKDEHIICECGKTNCLTKFISKSAIASRYKKSYEDFKEDILENKPEALEFVGEMCMFISEALSNITTLLDLDRIIFCGEISRDFKEILKLNLNKNIKENLSSWATFDEIKFHEDAHISKISSVFIMDYYFNSNDLLLWDNLMLKKELLND